MEIRTRVGIGDTVHYINENCPCSAPVLSIKIVVNDKDFSIKACTDVQREMWLPFGESGIWYKTTHGIYHESQIYLSREDLGKAIADGSFMK